VKVHGNQVWVVGIGTMLRAGWSQVRIPAGDKKFFSSLEGSDRV
jgi:hypothetical protein